MRYIVCLGFVALVTSSGALHSHPLQDAKKAEAQVQSDPAAQLKALQEKFESEQEAFFKLYQEAKDDAARQALMSQLPDSDAFAKQAIDLAKANPKTDTAREALVWASSQSRDDAVAASCYGILASDHLESEALGDVALGARYNGTESAANFLEKVAADSPHAKARGKAKFALANMLKDRAAGRGAGSGEDRKRAVDLLNECVDEYAGVEIYDAKLGDKAKGLLFAMENLAVGKPCPEITGSDADGVEFKLSDYRGKVVFLDFWGFW